MRAEFLLADGPLMSLSPAPELLTATWALLREAELAGRASRAAKEAAAGAVARANRCPFCVEAHALLVHGAGEHDLAEATRSGAVPSDGTGAAVVAWAGATRTPGDPALAAPPFPAEHAAEFLGTVLVSHFVNRMVTSLLDEDALIPQPLRSSGLLRRLAGLTVRRTARRPLQPGPGLKLLAGLPTSVPPAWAGGSPVGVAYATLRAVAAGGAALLGPEAQARVGATVAAWDGAHAPLGAGWLDTPLAGLPAADRPAARLALLAALAPYRLTEADVASWRASAQEQGTDANLVRVLAFGAITAVERIESWIAPVTAERTPA
ncbi:carboxymuconolactone decarboxylase family protein [Streptacidiphilus rugosus]|uniref:carboxymuconolactone decarboxylase family protein n=1 Tax=Streptacidiphilus rugosus TaxID=405783 RepID=UPI000A3F0CCE|nr:carboxymuconolactone decarboxylase family protein [Streptacidiphilus rugosus]